MSPDDPLYQETDPVKLKAIQAEAEKHFIGHGDTLNGPKWWMWVILAAAAMVLFYESIGYVLRWLGELI